MHAIVKGLLRALVAEYPIYEFLEQSEARRLRSAGLRLVKVVACGIPPGFGSVRGDTNVGRCSKDINSGDT